MGEGALAHSTVKVLMVEQLPFQSIQVGVELALPSTEGPLQINYRPPST